MADSNGNGRNQLPSFVQEQIKQRAIMAVDRADDIPGMPPNFGRYPITHISSFQGFVTSVANTYRDFDEALKHSLDNARFMRNDVGIMECIESRQRGVALLNWHLEPDDETSQEQKDLCAALTRLIDRVKRFTEYRYNLLHALWYGRYAIQHRYGNQFVRGKSVTIPTKERENCGWLPINGDKLVFRFDSDRLKDDQWPHQIGIRVGAGYKEGQSINGDRNRIEATDRGMAYFLTDAQRKMLAVHKHMIEDGAWEDPLSGGAVHGLGIRSRIYWEWFQMQSSKAFLMEYLERSAGGIELWKYPQGNPQAKTQVEEAAKKRIGGSRNMIMVPMPPGEEGFQYGVEIIEPGMAGIDALERILTTYHGHRIKRYILGQTLSSEAEATGLGSGVADLHYETFLQILRYDATNLEETITDDLVTPIKNWNYPKARHIPVWFRIDTEKTDQKEKLSAYEAAWNMGARIKEQDVFDVVGAAIPGPNDRVLTNPQIAQAQAQTQAMQQQQSMMAQQAAMGGMPPDFHGRSQVAVPNPQQDYLHLLSTLSGGQQAPSPVERNRKTGQRDLFSYMVRDPDLRAAIAKAAEDTEREPSEAAASAGNYRKGKFAFHGLEIAIETPQGATRRGKNSLGVPWDITMPAHYGYIRRHESEADGQHVDCFVGPSPESEIVFIIDQQTPGGRWDEHKVMLGFTTTNQARRTYMDAYPSSWKGLRDITAVAMPQFKAWLDHGDTSKPFSGQVSKYAKTWADSGGNVQFKWDDLDDSGVGPGGGAKGDNCGTGSGGFQPGNTCGGDGKGSSDTPATKDRVPVTAKKMGSRWYAMADLPGGKQVTRSHDDQAEAVKLAHQDIVDAGFEPHVPEDERTTSPNISQPDRSGSDEGPKPGNLFDPGADPKDAPKPLQPTLPGATEPQTTLRKGKHTLVGATVINASDLHADPSRFQYKIGH